MGSLLLGLRDHPPCVLFGLLSCVLNNLISGLPGFRRGLGCLCVRPSLGILDDLVSPLLSLSNDLGRFGPTLVLCLLYYLAGLPLSLIDDPGCLGFGFASRRLYDLVGGAFSFREQLTCVALSSIPGLIDNLPCCLPGLINDIAGLSLRPPVGLLNYLAGSQLGIGDNLSCVALSLPSGLFQDLAACLLYSLGQYLLSSSSRSGLGFGNNASCSLLRFEQS